jgi:hypothetical protein
MPESPSKSKRRGWEDSTWGEKMPISGINSLAKDKKLGQMCKQEAFT